jgi:hypothetical protein
MSDSAQGGLPLFYSNPVPIEAGRHGTLKIRKTRSYAYASQTNALPVVVDEFASLEGHYPIVFSTGDRPSALVLVGLRASENLFLEADGAWKAGYPVPAYVRRYPFILVESTNRERVVLCLEEDPAVVAPDGEVALFDDGKPTPAGNEALEFCVNFNRSADLTNLFCEELKQRGLLVEQRADVMTPTKQRISLSGFCVIDEAKFNALPDEVLLEWRKRNWLGLIYAHLLSLGRWNTLIELTAKKDERLI